jgi:hypothetical protein
MDPLGNVFRELLKRTEEENLRNASSLAVELLKEGMDRSQIEEMLYANGFDEKIVRQTTKDVVPEGE